MSEAGPARRLTALADLGRLPAQSRVVLVGRVLSIQLQDGALLVGDPSGTARVCPTELPSADALPEGSWVMCTGQWSGTSVTEASVELATRPAAPYPRPGGEAWWWGDDGGRRARNLASRARILAAVRSFFETAGFLEVETPLMVPSPGLDLHLDAFEVAGADRYLITSPEYQMKRLLVGGLPRVFQICRCFRRGEVGPRHQPEFTMLEWYRSFAGADEVMQDTERLVAHVARAVRGEPRIPSPLDGTSIELDPPWERMTVAEAFRRHAATDLDEVLPDEERFFRMLVTEVEPKLGGDRPVFLTRWPASMASLARLCPDDARVAERFEAYVGGLELCNGFGELTDPAEQRRRLVRDQSQRRAQGKPVYPIDERFLGALSEGMPPSGGNALGLDRLIMLILGEGRIDDVVAFPDERL